MLICLRSELWIYTTNLLIFKSFPVDDSYTPQISRRFIKQFSPDSDNKEPFNETYEKNYYPKLSLDNALKSFRFQLDPLS